MAAQVSACVPRVLALGVLALLASAASSATLAAGREATPTVSFAEKRVRAVPTELVVPDVRGRAYVFAKTSLEEAGFSWRIAGRVKGYPANLVITQRPAPGTRVIDTGGPMIVLELARNRGYVERGAPENASPYPGTALRLAGSVPREDASR